MRWSAVAAVLGMSLATGLLGGCAMYSPARDKQGQAVEQAWGKIDLQAQVEVPRQNLRALLDAQLATEDDLWRSRRGRIAAQMVTGMTIETLADRVDAAFTATLGSAADADALHAAVLQLAVADQGLDSIRRALAIGAMTPPTCAEVQDPARLQALRKRLDASLSDAQKDLWNGELPQLTADCVQVAAATAAIGAAQGLAGQAQAQLIQEQASLRADEDAAQALAADLRAAQQNYQQAVDAAASSPSGDAGQKVDELLEALKKVSDQVERAQNAIKTTIVSQQRLDSIKQFLATYDDVVADEGAPAGSNRFAIAIALFPDLADKSRQALVDVQKPNLVPLIIQKNIELAKLEAARRDVARRRQALQILQRQVDNLLAQGEAYRQIQAGLASPAVRPHRSAELRDFLQPYGDSASADLRTAKQAVWRAAARYLDVEGRQHAEFAKNRYRLSALEYEQAMTYAEASIDQWKGLIDPSVELMGDYGASGTKSSDIKGLIDSLMLLGIAIGVN